MKYTSNAALIIDYYFLEAILILEITSVKPTVCLQRHILAKLTTSTWWSFLAILWPTWQQMYREFQNIIILIDLRETQQS